MRRIAAALALLALGACTKSTYPAGVSRSAVLRVANYAEPSSLNPLLPTNTAEGFIEGLAFDLLVTVDDTGNDVPDLAARVPRHRALIRRATSRDDVSCVF